MNYYTNQQWDVNEFFISLAVSLPLQRLSWRVWLSPFPQYIPELNGKRSQTINRVMFTLTRRSQVRYNWMSCWWIFLLLVSECLCFVSPVRWPGEPSGDQRAGYLSDNQRNQIRHGQISLWGHCSWWHKVIRWDCDRPCCKRYSDVLSLLIELCVFLLKSDESQERKAWEPLFSP